MPCPVVEPVFDLFCFFVANPKKPRPAGETALATRPPKPLAVGSPKREVFVASVPRLESPFPIPPLNTLPQPPAPLIPAPRLPIAAPLSMPLNFPPLVAAPIPAPMAAPANGPIPGIKLTAIGAIVFRILPRDLKKPN